MRQQAEACLSGYAKVHEHRAAALVRGDLIATSVWSIAAD